MEEKIEKYGIIWNKRKAKTNDLYTVNDESSYNSCNIWFMLVQDKNNQTQYLAFHNTSKTKDQIVTHIRTSTYSLRQKLYEIDNIGLNNNPNMPKQSRTDYDTIFNDKNLYAIPEQYIDIIGKIDPNLAKYIKKFKERNGIEQQNIYLLSVAADSVESTDTEFTMDNLSLGDNFKPVDVYFQTANGNKITRNLDKREKKISNQTMPRVAFQIFEKQISEMPEKEKQNFPICRYSLNSETIYGIYSSKEEYKNYRNTIEYMEYNYGNNKQFVIYCWNIFSTIIFVQECLKRFGNPGDKFILNYTPKSKNETESTIIETRRQRDNTMKNISISQSLNQILYGPPGTGKTYNTVLKAMSIMDNTEYKDVSDEKYSELKTRFDELKQAGQIEFVTFHQSYSYEEFVEGIKPYIQQWNSESGDCAKYKGENGIFKNICNNANCEFKKIFNKFKEKYSEGNNLETLYNLKYDEQYIIYDCGENAVKDNQNRKISIEKLKWVYDKNRQYSNATDFYQDYKNEAESLKCYPYKVYCELLKLKKDFDKPYILIIDEINRGDVSKIFGELITLIEEDKRTGNKYQMKSTLPYSKESFGVPNNLYIIGTMNTADRSIALLDTALRRRFDFEEIPPKPELLKNEKINGTEINPRALLTNLNNRIEEYFDKDHKLGHSYLMGIETKEQLERSYKNRILPLLNEYFYNDSETVGKVLNCKKYETTNCLEVLKETQKEYNKGSDDQE